MQMNYHVTIAVLIGGHLHLVQVQPISKQQILWYIFIYLNILTTLKYNASYGMHSLALLIFKLPKGPSDMHNEHTKPPDPSCTCTDMRCMHTHTLILKLDA